MPEPKLESQLDKELVRNSILCRENSTGRGLEARATARRSVGLMQRMREEWKTERRDVARVTGEGVSTMS